MKKAAIMALFTAVAGAIVGWPIWVTSTLYQVKADVMVIRQAVRPDVVQMIPNRINPTTTTDGDPDGR